MLRRTFLKTCSLVIGAISSKIGLLFGAGGRFSRTPKHDPAIESPVEPLVGDWRFRQFRGAPAQPTPSLTAAFRRLDKMPCGKCGEPLNEHANFTDELSPASCEWAGVSVRD